MANEWESVTEARALGPAPGSPFLVVVTAPARLQLGRVVALTKTQAVGRSGEADVALPDASMSRRHAELVVDGGTITVRDLGSRNGTWVNGVRVTEAVLRDGDRLQLGATRLHFHAPQGEAVEPWPGEALEQAGVALWECAVPARTIRWSKHADSALGLPPGTLPRESAPLSAVLHPEERADTRWLDGAAVDRPVQLLVGNQVRWVHLRAQRVAGPPGRADRFFGTAIDVTAVRQREEAVVRHALVFDNLGDPVLVTDCDGQVVDLNSAARQAFGVTKADAQGRELFSLVGAREPEVLGPSVLAALSASGRWTAELPLATASGARVFEALGFHLKEGAEVVGAAWLLRDVSERRRLEARLNHLDRLASLGTMSAGIAHELNNPLSYVLANARFVLERLDGADAEVREALGDLQDGALRIASIVGDLRTFSRSDTQLETQPTDLCQVLDAALRVTAKLVNARAKVEVQVDGLPQVEAFEPRLVQVLVNLLLNAAQAIPEAPEPKGHITVRATAEGNGVALEVADDGEGMTPEVQQRVFDPFFTTRPVGFGAGLGLAVCHGVVTAMGGTLSVHSAPGQGSTFRLWLRRAQPRYLATPTPTPLAVSNRPLKVLMVDDEPLVLKAMGRILRQHEVTQAHSVADALARLDAGEAYDVVLCDLMMPERSGIDFYEALQQKAPALLQRVVFLTGGAFTERAQRFLSGVPNKQLIKPVDATVLRQVVREVGAAA